VFILWFFEESELAEEGESEEELSDEGLVEPRQR